MRKEIEYADSHAAEVSALAWNQDGTILASAGRDKSIMLWKNDEFAATLMGHKTAIYDLSWNPTSNFLASCSGDKTGLIWDGQDVHAKLSGHKGAVTMIDWSPEGSIIATGSADKTVRLWNSEGEVQHILEHKSALASLRWNPRQENLLATGSYDRTVQLWKNGESVTLLKGHRDRVFGLGWSNDGKTLASSSGFKDGEIIVWNDSGEKLTSHENHTSSIYQVSGNPSSDMLASASFDGTARLWNLDGELAVLRHPGPVFIAKWNNQGDLLATAGMGIVAIWDATKFT